VSGLFLVAPSHGRPASVVVNFALDPKVAATAVLLSDKPGQIALAGPILACGWACHFSALPIIQEMRERRKAGWAVHFTMLGIVMAINLSFGLVGYLKFGASVSPNVLKEFARKGPLTMSLACAAVAFTNLAKYPLLLLPARKCVLDLLEAPSHGSVPFRWRFGVSLALVGSTAALAVICRRLDILFDLIGSTGVAIVCLILPGAFFVRLQEWRAIGGPTPVGSGSPLLPHSKLLPRFDEASTGVATGASSIWLVAAGAFMVVVGTVIGFVGLGDTLWQLGKGSY
jgi:amino acid permease